MCPNLGRGVINAVRQAVRVALRDEVTGATIVATRHKSARNGALPPGRHNVRDVLVTQSVKPAGSLVEGCRSRARVVTADARTLLRATDQRSFDEAAEARTGSGIGHRQSMVFVGYLYKVASS